MYFFILDDVFFLMFSFSILKKMQCRQLLQKCEEKLKMHAQNIAVEVNF